MAKKDEEKCEAIGTGYDPADQACKDCAKDYPEDFTTCKSATENLAAAAPPVEEPAKEDPKPTEEGPKEDSKPTTEEAKVVRLKNIPKVREVCKRLISEGKPKDEVLVILTKMYEDTGRDEKYSSQRAKVIYNSVTIPPKKEAPKEEAAAAPPTKEAPKEEAPKEEAPKKGAK